MLLFSHLPSITKKQFVPGTTKSREHRDKPEFVLDLMELQGQEGVRSVSLVSGGVDGQGCCRSTEEGEEVSIHLGHGVPY